jgi:hypothetical protein
MRSFVVSLAVVIALIVVGGLAFIYSGLFDVAASEHVSWTPKMRQLAKVEPCP